MLPEITKSENNLNPLLDKLEEIKKVSLSIFQEIKEKPKESKKAFEKSFKEEVKDLNKNIKGLLEGFKGFNVSEGEENSESGILNKILGFVTGGIGTIAKFILTNPRFLLALGVGVVATFIYVYLKNNGGKIWEAIKQKFNKEVKSKYDAIINSLQQRIQKFKNFLKQFKENPLKTIGIGKFLKEDLEIKPTEKQTETPTESSIEIPTVTLSKTSYEPIEPSIEESPEIVAKVPRELIETSIEESPEIVAQVPEEVSPNTEIKGLKRLKEEADKLKISLSSNLKKPTTSKKDNTDEQSSKGIAISKKSNENSKRIEGISKSVNGSSKGIDTDSTKGKESSGGISINFGSISTSRSNELFHVSNEYNEIIIASENVASSIINKNSDIIINSPSVSYNLLSNEDLGKYYKI